MSVDREETRRDAEKWLDTQSERSEGKRIMVALLAELEQAERERDAYVAALAHERSLNESVVAPMRDRLAKVPALLEALNEISEGEHNSSRDPAIVANDALADWENE